MAVHRAEQAFRRHPSLMKVTSILELVEFNARENPHRAFAIQAIKSDDASAPRLCKISCLDLITAVVCCSKWLENIKELATSSVQAGQSGSRKRPVGILMGNEISLWIHMLSLMSQEIPVRFQFVLRKGKEADGRRCY